MSRRGKVVHSRPTRAQIQDELKKSESDFFQPPEEDPEVRRLRPLMISLVVLGICCLVLLVLIVWLSGSDLGM